MAGARPKVVAEESNASGRAAPSSQIWGDGRACGGKITRRRMLAGSALATLVIVGLALGLYFGLSESSESTTSRAVAQDVDPGAIGCFADERFSRVMTDVLTDEALTPEICDAYCESLGQTYYGLQWGIECWCGGPDTVLDRHGDGVCDMACGGDPNSNCGGYLAFAAYEVGTLPTSPETSPTPTPDVDCTGKATIRLASATAYFESSGCGTLTDMYEFQGDSTDGPLYVLDEDDNIIPGGTPTGRWLLTRDLRVTNGGTLLVHGTSIGGDCDVLRIRSDGSSAFHEIRGHGGSLSFRSTKVTSWDTENGKQQTDYSSGRSYINCISEFLGDGDCSKNNMGECRMDIIDSEMGDLGWKDSESYGLTWKVRGLCTDLSNLDIFDRVQVYGDIQNSDIYGMYYGMYSYGHEGGVWINNKMHDNHQYGFDPHDDSDNLIIAGNTVYNNVNHGIIASKRCNNVEIYDNEVYNGGDEAVGIFLHRSSNGNKVYDNYVHGMGDAGLAIMESYDAEIYNNVVEDVKYGLRISLGGGNNYIHDNKFDGCSQYGFYTYMGSDEPDESPDGRPVGNIFEANEITSTKVGVKITDGDDNEFIDNYWTGTEELEFRDSDGTLWSGNIMPSGVCYKSEGSTFASGSDLPPAC